MESSIDDERRFRNSKIESSSRRKNSDVEYLFPNSVNREDNDEEEALKWAAIQRLPTVARLRTGLLMTSEGEANEIDIHHLKQEEKKFLLERLVRIADIDNEKFLLKLRDRVHRLYFYSYAVNNSFSFYHHHSNSCLPIATIININTK